MKKLSKKEIYNMLSFVLEEGESDTDLLADWTDVLYQIYSIRKKFPRPTSNILTIDDEIFQTKKMKIFNNYIKIDSNHQSHWLKENKPDINVYGDVSIESCEKNLNIIGNVNGEKIYVKGELNVETICNYGNLTIICEKLKVEDLRASGIINIETVDFRADDFSSETSHIKGNIVSTFFSSNKTEIYGDLKSNSISEKVDDDFSIDFNKPSK
jgi:hypothetical protein